MYWTRYSILTVTSLALLLGLSLPSPALGQAAPKAKATKRAKSSARKASPQAPASAATPASPKPAQDSTPKVDNISTDENGQTAPSDQPQKSGQLSNELEMAAGRPSSVQIQLRLLADKLKGAFDGRPGNGRYERWAVVPFDDVGDEVKKRQLGTVIAAEVETRLKNDHGLVLVERMQMAKLLKEMQLAMLGVVDESTASEVGKMLDAQVLVTGSVALLGEDYVVHAKVISVEEAKVLATADLRFAAKGLIALSSEAVVLRTKSDAFFRSMLVPGWGQLYNRQTAKGVTVMAGSVALLGGGIGFYFLGANAEKKYQRISESNLGPCSGFEGVELGSCVESQRLSAENHYLVSRILFISFGALYAYNLIDAWVSGYSHSDADKARYASGWQFDLAPGWAGVSGEF